MNSDTRSGDVSRFLSWLLCGCWIAAFAGIRASAAGLLGEQRMVLIDGQPRLVLGLYENPADDSELQELVRNGFNLFQCSADTVALDRVGRLGAKAWVNLGEALDLSASKAERSARLDAIVDRLSSHPALLIWEGPDEILWNQWWVSMETLRAELRTMRELGGGREAESSVNEVQSLLERGLYPEFEQAREAFWARVGKPCPNPKVRVDDAPERVRRVGEGISEGIRHVRRRDPYHVVWLNHAPRNSLDDLRWFNREADMVGCDIYPVPANLDVGHSDLRDMTLGSVGAYTRRMQWAGAKGRACAMVLQGFGWRDLREKVTEAQMALGVGRPPTFAESRFMAYDSLLQGANAILYWGTAYAKARGADGTPVPGRPRLWQDLMKLGRELRALEPAFLAAPVRGVTVIPAPTFGSHEQPPLLVSLRRVGADDVLLVANESPHGLRFTVRGLPAHLSGHTLHRLGTQESQVVERGRIEDGIRAWDVHVYATSRRFEPAAR